MDPAGVGTPRLGEGGLVVLWQQRAPAQPVSPPLWGCWSRPGFSPLPPPHGANPLFLLPAKSEGGRGGISRGAVGTGEG